MHTYLKPYLFIPNKIILGLDFWWVVSFFKNIYIPTTESNFVCTLYNGSKQQTDCNNTVFHILIHLTWPQFQCESLWTKTKCFLDLNWNTHYLPSPLSFLSPPITLSPSRSFKEPTLWLTDPSCCSFLSQFH